MTLLPAFESLAKTLQEAATIAHSDVRSRLSDAAGKVGGYYMDHTGDGETGHVIYHDSKSGDMHKAPYSISGNGGKDVSIASDKAKKVQPSVTYVGEAPKHEEAATAELDLTGEVIPLKEGAVGQDGSAYLKLIAPGWGSSAYYPEKVLESDGAKAFPKGTKNFWNHQTDLQERERPEGDLRDLASVLTEDAHYEKKGPAGPGLYARAKVMEQFRQSVDDLAPHIGMSIRATGKAKEGKVEGKSGPILETLTRGISVDYVTTPGAGGKVLQLFEAARHAKITKLSESGTSGETDMDAKEVQTLLQESSAKLLRRLAISEAREMIASETADIRLPKATLSRLTESLTASVPTSAEGELDRKAFKVLIEAGIKSEAAYLREVGGGAHVTGLGAAADTDPKLAEAERERRDKEDRQQVKRLAEKIGLKTKMGKRVFAEGRSAFDPNYNALNDGIAVTAGAGLED